MLFVMFALHLHLDKFELTAELLIFTLVVNL